MCFFERLSNVSYLNGLPKKHGAPEVTEVCGEMSGPQQTSMAYFIAGSSDDDGQNQLSSRQEDQLLELKNDGGLKTLFISTPLTSFWIKASKEYTEISTLALKTLLPFPTSYQCEAGFSAMNATKTRLRLDVRNTLRVSLSTIKPRYDVLVAAKQSQGSH
ncbi:SCAN domain-containing protein 3-like [Tachysurus ichikawai]